MALRLPPGHSASDVVASEDMPVLRHVDSVASAGELLTWLGERRHGAIAFDVETTGLHWWRDKIRLAQLGDERVGWSVPWEQWGGVFAEAMGRYTGPLVGHNMTFDWHNLREHGVDLSRHRIGDTQALAHLVNPLKVGLKDVASREFGDWASWWEDRLKHVFRSQGWDWATVPVDHPAYLEYGAADCVLTARLDSRLGRIVRDQGWWDLYELELASEAILADMEVRGVRVDRTYASMRSRQMGEEALGCRKRLADEWGLSDPGSSRQLIAALLANGVVLTERTDKGTQFKVDAAVLKSLRGHPLADLILKMRRAEKWKAAYFDKVLDLLDLDGDILHPSFKSLGARTARMACSNPPMQQIPRGADVRDCFVARPDHRLVLADMDQIEMRLMVHFANPPALRAAMERGDDLHALVAAMAFGVPIGDVDAGQRQVAKSASYAKIYGASSARFAQTVGLPPQIGADFYERYDNLIPEVARFQEDVIRLGRRRAMTEGVGYVVTPLGRRLPCDRGREFALVNYVIQGCAADVFKRSLIALDRAGWSRHLVLVVHDEVILDVPDELVGAAQEEVPRLIGDHTSFSVPLTAGVAVFDRWGDKARRKVAP